MRVLRKAERILKGDIVDPFWKDEQWKVTKVVKGISTDKIEIEVNRNNSQHFTFLYPDDLVPVFST